MSLPTYKGHTATVESDPDDQLLVGRIAGINDVVGFHGRSRKKSWQRSTKR